MVKGSLACDRGTCSFTVTPRCGGQTSHATGKYLWPYSRTTDGAWKLARVLVPLDEEDEHEAEGPQ